tara:strand:- start:349 stop:1224 length:876 start_codon:yes stop_codon:yes gene_type:complete
MNISDFTKPITAKSLNESLAKRFGKKINLEGFSLEQLQDVRNRIRTQLFNVETNESFDSVQRETYQKSKMMLDILNAELSERGDIAEAKPDFPDLDNDGDEKEPMKKALKDKALKDKGSKPKKGKVPPQFVKEGAEDHAELVMAAKDMVDRVTGWMEDTAEMQTESMLELSDAIRDELGAEKAEEFTSLVKPALDSLYSTMEQARASLTGAVGMITGESEAPMMGDDGMDDMDMEPTVDGEVDLDMEADPDMDGTDFGAAEAGTGGDEPEERAKRESIDPRKLGKILSKKK